MAAKANALKILNSESLQEGRKLHLLIGSVLREEGTVMPQNIIKYHHIITRELLQFVKQKTGFIYKKKKKSYWPK